MGALDLNNIPCIFAHNSAMDGKLYDAKKALNDLRRKHFG